MASVGSITPTFFHYRTVYIAVEELCSVGVVFRWLAGHLQQLCEMPFFFSRWLLLVQFFLLQMFVEDWESSPDRRWHLEALKPFRAGNAVGRSCSWQGAPEKACCSCSSSLLVGILSLQSPGSAVASLHCLCAVWEGLVTLSVKPGREGGGLATVLIIFVSYYYKTETNSLPSQLAVVTL